MWAETLTADCKPHAEPGARIKGQVLLHFQLAPISWQLLLCLHGVKIRQSHVGRWSRHCWGLLGPGALGLPPFLLPVIPLLSYSLLLLSFSSTAVLFSVPSHPASFCSAFHPIQCSCCFDTSQERSFSVPVAMKSWGVKRCHVHVH